VSLFQRSFPQADIRPDDADEDAISAPADIVASYETIATFLSTNEESIARSFIALQPEMATIASLRSKYSGGNPKPLIGFSWTSKNQNKELPPIGHWAKLIAEREATYVSLQYGDTADALGFFRKTCPFPVIHDPEVDQFRDFDVFAAQIKALDFVVSISNTGVHLTGALGVPAIVVLGDKFHLNWPVSGPSPWHPHTTLIRRTHRPWEAVFSDAAKAMDAATAAIKAG
jgi:ADP-heptose:LPS heptosyltransferase